MFVLRKFLPRSLRRIVNMSRRQAVYELRGNLWFSSVIYAAAAVVLAFITYWIDFNLTIEHATPNVMHVTHEYLYTVLGTLLAGVITLNAFTFNSTLVVLTTFSGQFSPRLLLTFISDKRTQRVLGLFNAAFIYLLASFFMLHELVHEIYVAIPLTAFIMTLLAMANFVYFINHVVKWMQVPTLTHNMKMESSKRIMGTLQKDLEPYRDNDLDQSAHQYSRREAHVIRAEQTGFLQIIDFKKLIKFATEDDIVVQIEVRVGDFITRGMPILRYWSDKQRPEREDFYRNMLYLGHKKTELQDLEYGINKLKEVAIKSIGNYDPSTTRNAINQLSDLLIDVATITKFTPYLTNRNNELRLIIPDESFDYYLHTAFSQIVYYGENDPVLLNDILDGLTTVAQSVYHEDMKCTWEFAEHLMSIYKKPNSFKYEDKRFTSSLRQLAVMTHQTERYNELTGEGD
ncbi:putative membrane protein [Salisediminibacterium halotolerans]|nr:putative membrane protein [Actinophytocola xinjiangensis]RPE86618.1 putative membrane protein [Salisediminibacterium halotolerans]TWG33993.1 putative membrane protein [Salisediminibacterium halotolerans]GEL06600.1 hypothetical protein SHA02_00160 [Salisediminibacterium halotolerans]